MTNQKKTGSKGSDDWARSENEDSSGNPQAQGENSLSSRDHSILEKAIRGKVAQLVGSSHPELASDPAGRPKEDAHPQQILRGRDSISSAWSNFDSSILGPDDMPGAEKAIGFRNVFASALIDPNPHSHRKLIEELQSANLPIKTLAIHLFSPVAAGLGEMWCEDETDFMQVAIASTRLSMIVNNLSKSGVQTPTSSSNARSALLAHTSGARHTIGVSIIAACLRDMGWLVDGGGDLETGDDLFFKLARRDYQLVGMSVGTVQEADECTHAISVMQAAPRQAPMRIAIGGPAVIADPDAFSSTGADIIARSALDAFKLIDRYAS